MSGEPSNEILELPAAVLEVPTTPSLEAFQAIGLAKYSDLYPEEDGYGIHSVIKRGAEPEISSPLGDLHAQIYDFRTQIYQIENTLEGRPSITRAALHASMLQIFLICCIDAHYKLHAELQNDSQAALIFTRQDIACQYRRMREQYEAVIGDREREIIDLESGTALDEPDHINGMPIINIDAFYPVPPSKELRRQQRHDQLERLQTAYLRRLVRLDFEKASAGAIIAVLETDQATS